MGLVDILSNNLSPMEYLVYSWRANSPWKHLHIATDIGIPLVLGIYDGLTYEPLFVAIGKQTWLLGLDFINSAFNTWNEGLNYTVFASPEELIEFAEEKARYLALATGASDLRKRWKEIRDTEAKVRGIDYSFEARTLNIARFTGQSAFITAMSYMTGYGLGVLIKRGITEMAVHAYMANTYIS